MDSVKELDRIELYCKHLLTRRAFTIHAAIMFSIMGYLDMSDLRNTKWIR